MEPTVTLLGLVSANTAADTCSAVNLGREVPGQAALGLAMPATAAGEEEGRWVGGWVGGGGLLQEVGQQLAGKQAGKKAGSLGTMSVPTSLVTSLLLLRVMVAALAAGALAAAVTPPAAPAAVLRMVVSLGAAAAALEAVTVAALKLRGAPLAAACCQAPVTSTVMPVWMPAAWLSSASTTCTRSPAAVCTASTLRQGGQEMRGNCVGGWVVGRGW